MENSRRHLRLGAAWLTSRSEEATLFKGLSLTYVGTQDVAPQDRAKSKLLLPRCKESEIQESAEYPRPKDDFGLGVFRILPT